MTNGQTKLGAGGEVASSRFGARALSVALCAFGLGLVGGACIDNPTYGGVASNTGGQVYTDAFGSGLSYAAFKGSKLDALSVDTTTAHTGRNSLKITVPALDSASGTFAGGAFIANDARNLSKYDALTFWAKASQAAKLDTAGLGNDNTGTSKYTAQIGPLTLGTDWQKYTLPIPLAAKLVSEKGMFFFAASAKAVTPNGPFTLWMDDVQYETLGTALGPATATINNEAATLTTGTSTAVHGAGVSFLVNGAAEPVVASNGYFTFTSSNPAVASVDEAGTVSALTVGSTSITAQLGAVTATGTLSVNVVGQDTTVISLLSAKYPAHTVEKWLADWSMPMGQITNDPTPDGADPMETYTKVQYFGIEFVAKANQLDLSQMTAMHFDLKTPDSVDIQIKLVDFGPNGIVDPPTDGIPHGDDSARLITVGASSTPPLTPNQWVSFDIPFSQFALTAGPSPGATNRSNVAQIAVIGPGTPTPLVSTMSLKNVYFHK